MELGRIYSAYSHASSRIVRGFTAHPTEFDTSTCSDAHGLTREAALIQLQDRWNGFCRSLILRSAVGGIRTLSGLNLVRAYSSEAAALQALRGTFTGRDRKGANWEPKWFDPSEAIDAASRLVIPNYATVSAALGATPSPLEELRCVRNFFAHRGALAATTMRRVVGVGCTLDAHAYVVAPQLGGATRFETWALTMERQARAAVV